MLLAGMTQTRVATQIGVPSSCYPSFDLNFVLGKGKSAAMLKISGRLSSSSTYALEVLTNTVPLDLLFKLRQTQEFFRISDKRDNKPLKRL